MNAIHHALGPSREDEGENDARARIWEWREFSLSKLGNLFAANRFRNHVRFQPYVRFAQTTVVFPKMNVTSRKTNVEFSMLNVQFPKQDVLHSGPNVQH